MILWSCLLVFYILWLFVFSKLFGVTFGISSNLFSIFCGSIATLSGILLGFVIATISLVMQTSFPGRSAIIDVLAKNVSSLETWLRNKNIQNIVLVNKLEKLCDLCKSTITRTKEKMDEDDVDKTRLDIKDDLKNMLQNSRTKVERYEERINELKTKKPKQMKKRS